MIRKKRHLQIISAASSHGYFSLTWQGYVPPLDFFVGTQFSPVPNQFLPWLSHDCFESWKPNIPRSSVLGCLTGIGHVCQLIGWIWIAKNEQWKENLVPWWKTKICSQKLLTKCEQGRKFLSTFTQWINKIGQWISPYYKVKLFYRHTTICIRIMTFCTSEIIWRLFAYGRPGSALFTKTIHCLSAAVLVWK